MSESVPEQIIDEVFDSMQEGVRTAIGRRETAAHAGAPRVVAIPLGASVIDPVDMPGGRLRDGGRERAIALRRLVIEWQCHGKSFFEAEELYLDVLRSIRSKAHNSVQFSNERWIDQEDGSDGFDKFGTLISFIATFDVPVYEERQQLRFLQFQTECFLNEESAHDEH